MEKKIKTLYVAHTFVYRHFVKDKLCKFLHKIGIDTNNPFYLKDGSTVRPEVTLADKMEIEGIDPDTNKAWLNMIKQSSESIVTTDLQLIDKSDGIVAFMSSWSGGTTCEIFYTGFVRKKPVFLISNNISIYRHPWMMESCKYGKIFKSYEAFKDYMRKNL